MPRRPKVIIASIAFIFCLSTAFFILPATSGGAFLSPDETAVAVSARQFAQIGSFAIPDPMLKDFPWAHPRSFVVRDATLVPVGFLGMPLLMAVAWRIAGDVGLFLFTPLLALSVLIPLWTFGKSFGRVGQVATVVGWVTFPTVILYANRGLFPNLVAACLVIWSAFFLWRSRRTRMLFFAGIFCGFALLVRPTELLWIVPWLVFARVKGVSHVRDVRSNIRDAFIFTLPVLLLAGIGAFLAWKTYGSPWISGYQLRDPHSDLVLSTTNDGTQNISWFESWPFGFHPRNVWFNVRAYLIVYLWPWFALTLVTTIFGWRLKAARPWMALAAWTGAVLALVYGQGIYQDHVRAFHTSLANSFLRYLTPASVIAALTLGWFSGSVVRLVGSRGRIVAATLVSIMGIFGLWTATVRDDEGLLKNRIELERYETIRASAIRALSPDAVVLSERSDKIFFPQFRAVSPLPPRERINQLVRRPSGETALFIRSLDAAGLESWRADGLRLEAILDAGNETLYRVVKEL